MSEDLERENAESPRSEWIKFGVLAAIMLGAVLVVALLRPYIFNHVVPAVMGEGVEQPAGPVDGNEAYPIMIPVVSDGEKSPSEESSEPNAAEEVPVEEAYPAPETDVEVETVEEEMGSDIGSGEVETAVTTIDHTVQPNENLTTIAKQYNTTIQAILDANDIPNPNRIDAGTVLHIPQP